MIDFCVRKVEEAKDITPTEISTPACIVLERKSWILENLEIMIRQFILQNLKLNNKDQSH